ncbi:hypothetical protein ACQY0O_007862 [Thecaphora frezii]
MTSSLSSSLYQALLFDCPDHKHELSSLPLQQPHHSASSSNPAFAGHEAATDGTLLPIPPAQNQYHTAQQPSSAPPASFPPHPHDTVAYQGCLSFLDPALEQRSLQAYPSADYGGLVQGLPPPEQVEPPYLLDGRFLQQPWQAQHHASATPGSYLPQQQVQQPCLLLSRYQQQPWQPQHPASTASGSYPPPHQAQQPCQPYQYQKQPCYDRSAMLSSASPLADRSKDRNAGMALPQPQPITTRQYIAAGQFSGKMQVLPTNDEDRESVLLCLIQMALCVTLEYGWRGLLVNGIHWNGNILDMPYDEYKKAVHNSRQLFSAQLQTTRAWDWKDIVQSSIPFEVGDLTITLKCISCRRKQRRALRGFYLFDVYASRPVPALGSNVQKREQIFMGDLHVPALLCM